MKKVPLLFFCGFMSSFVWRKEKKRLLPLPRTQNYLRGRETAEEALKPEVDLIRAGKKVPFFKQLGQLLIKNVSTVCLYYLLLFSIILMSVFRTKTSQSGEILTPPFLTQRI